MGRKYYRPKRRQYRSSGLKGLLVALATAWLGSRARSSHYRGRRPSMKSSAIGFVLKRLARRFG